MQTAQWQGFTLIEMSIVLVIIGLIVGGVLTGQDLIRTAAVRAQISQIEKYNTAVNTFRDKYGALPGDITPSAATQFGFVSRIGSAGLGDGNGVIEGNPWNLPGGNTGFNWIGETTYFWADLTMANLIDGIALNPACPVCWTGGDITATTSPNVNAYLPVAKMDSSSSVYVWSWNGNNYFGFLNGMVLGEPGWTTGNMNLTVQQAYSIDNKMDDGSPTSGNVTAAYVYGGQILYPGYSTSLNQPVYWPTTAGTATSCFDNGGVAVGVSPFVYSTETGSNSLNCAVSFQFQ